MKVIRFFEIELECPECEQAKSGEAVSHNTWHWPHYEIDFCLSGDPLPAGAHVIEEMRIEDLKRKFPSSYTIVQAAIARCNELG